MIDQINALLPQTQCGQCGFQGCRPYAEAIAAGAADINQCPPGGDEGILDLANLLGVAPKPLNVLVMGPGPRVAELADIGVRRISVGGALARVVWGALLRAAEQIKAGSFDGLANATPGMQLNDIFDSFA